MMWFTDSRYVTAVFDGLKEYLNCISINSTFKYCTVFSMIILNPSLYTLNVVTLRQSLSRTPSGKVLQFPQTRPALPSLHIYCRTCFAVTLFKILPSYLGMKEVGDFPCWNFSRLVLFVNVIVASETRLRRLFLCLYSEIVWLNFAWSISESLVINSYSGLFSLGSILTFHFSESYRLATLPNST